MWYIILFAVTLVIDQVSKIITDAYKLNVPVIEGIFNIKIAYNRGASFSFLSNQEWAQTFFIILTSVVLVAGLLFVIIQKPKGKWINSTIALLFSGTIGNFIDRIAFGYVRDFIDFSSFFANFNIADSCLCIGAGMLIFYVLFLEQDAVFKFKKNKNKSKESGGSGV